MSSSGRRLTGEDFRRMALAAAALIDSEQASLSRLDAAGGDGDHGANMRAGMAAARDLIASQSNPRPASVLSGLAVAFREHMGGAGGVLLGEFFAGLEDTFGLEQDVDALALAEGLAAGAGRLSRLGRAEVGDKTMVDAVEPAVHAASEAASKGQSPPEVLAQAASAARAGADATKDLVPRLGRARYAPDRAIGIPDAGATTVALILEAWAGAVGTGNNE